MGQVMMSHKNRGRLILFGVFKALRHVILLAHAMMGAGDLIGTCLLIGIRGQITWEMPRVSVYDAASKYLWVQLLQTPIFVSTYVGGYIDCRDQLKLVYRGLTTIRLLCGGTIFHFFTIKKTITTTISSKEGSNTERFSTKTCGSQSRSCFAGHYSQAIFRLVLLSCNLTPPLNLIL